MLRKVKEEKGEENSFLGRIANSRPPRTTVKSPREIATTRTWDSSTSSPSAAGLPTSSSAARSFLWPQPFTPSPSSLWYATKGIYEKGFRCTFSYIKGCLLQRPPHRRRRLHPPLLRPPAPLRGAREGESAGETEKSPKYQNDNLQNCNGFFSFFLAPPVPVPASFDCCTGAG